MSRRMNILCYTDNSEHRHTIVMGSSSLPAHPMHVYRLSEASADTEVSQRCIEDITVPDRL